MIKIGIIGAGYWGKHYVRILSRLPCKLVGVADSDTSKERLAKEYSLAFYTDYRKLLAKADAVTIVTPPATHYKIAKKAIKKSLHVLLEKPFVFNRKEAVELKELADLRHLVLMAGHTYLYHPAVNRIKELLENGELGNIYYLLLQWLNLGIVRRDVNALWNFAPHAFSILYYLLGRLPVKIQVNGRAFIQESVEDVIFASFFYKDLMAQVNLSWLHPLKVREITIVGSKKLIHFDDAKFDSQLVVYDKGISPEEFSKAISWENFAEFKSKIRYGKVEIPKLPEEEPLQLQLKDFINAVEKKKTPKANIDSAVAVVSMLETAQRSLAKGGLSIETKNRE